MPAGGRGDEEAGSGDAGGTADDEFADLIFPKLRPRVGGYPGTNQVEAENGTVRRKIIIMTFDPIECATKIGHLTPRMREVLGLIAEGCQAKEIADRMKISINTASNYSVMIYRTLGVSNRVEAARVALAAGGTPALPGKK
jgi:DNA-binding NarL/FixJ family response regulator